MADEQQTEVAEVDPIGTDAAFLNSPGYQNVEAPPADDDSAAEDAETQEDAATQAAAEDDTEQGSEEETAESGTDEDASPDDIDALIEKFATETGLDPKDSSQRKTLSRLAHKEQHILRQDARIAELEKNGKASGELTDAEQELFDSYTKDDESPKSDAEPPAKQDDNKPLYESWNSAADGYQAMTKAWELVKEKGDFSKVNEVDQAFFSARVLAATPHFQKIAQQVIKETFGDLLPDIEASVRTRREDTAREWALQKLSKEKGFENIDDLFKAEPDSEPIIDGEDKFPNSPLNRILSENPEIMDINVTHFKGKPLSEQDALRATFLKRYRLIQNLAKRGKIDSKRAKKLVQSGAEMEKRTKTDRVRQELNRGPGARQDQQEESYGKTLAKAGRGGAASLADL
jgi:hypothetical protein